MRRSIAISLAAALLTISVHASAADDPEKLFADGNALMEAQKWQDALAKFEEAQKRDPGVGTQFNIAVCHQKLGHLATAYRNFVEVQKLAHAAGKTAREESSNQKIAEIKPQLSYFVIQPADPADLLVKVDGAIVDRSAWSFVPVDAGSHHIEASAPSKKPWAADFPAPAGGQRADVIIPVLKTAEGKTITVTKETSNTKRTVGYVVGGVGVVGLVAAGVTSVMILNAKSTADQHCSAPPDNHCVDASGKLDTTGTDAVSQGKTLLPINAIAWGVGAVGVGVGAFLILTSGKKTEEPSTAPKASFMPLPGGGYFGLSGAL